MSQGIVKRMTLMGFNPLFFFLHFLDRLRIVVNGFTVKIWGELLVSR